MTISIVPSMEELYIAVCDTTACRGILKGNILRMTDTVEVVTLTT